MLERGKKTTEEMHLKDPQKTGFVMEEVMMKLRYRIKWKPTKLIAK